MPKAEPLFRCFTARCDGSACHVRLSGARVPPTLPSATLIPAASYAYATVGRYTAAIVMQTSMQTSRNAKHNTATSDSATAQNYLFIIVPPK